MCMAVHITLHINIFKALMAKYLCGHLCYFQREYALTVYPISGNISDLFLIAYCTQAALRLSENH